MRPVGGDPEEERAAAWSGAAHEPDRLVGEDVGLVGVGPTRLAAVVNDLPVLVEIEVERALLVRGGEAVPLAPPGRYLAYRLARPVAVEELADEGGAIAGVRQPHGEGVIAVEALVPAARPCVVAHAVVVRVLTRKEGGPRRAAEREAHECVIERGAALADQPPGERHRAHGVERLVVGHDHDDVQCRALDGFRGRCRLCAAARTAATQRRKRRDRQRDREPGSSRGVTWVSRAAHRRGGAAGSPRLRPRPGPAGSRSASTRRGRACRACRGYWLGGPRRSAR